MGSLVAVKRAAGLGETREEQLGDGDGGITGSVEGGNACLGKAGGFELGEHSWGFTAGRNDW